MDINFINFEELIVNNKDIKLIHEKYDNDIKFIRMLSATPHLADMKLKHIINLLNKFDKSDELYLYDFFKEEVNLVRLNHSKVLYRSFKISELHESLSKINWIGNYNIQVDDNFAHILFWR